MRFSFLSPIKARAILTEFLMSVVVQIIKWTGIHMITYTYCWYSHDFTKIQTTDLRFEILFS